MGKDLSAVSVLQRFGRSLRLVRDRPRPQGPGRFPGAPAESIRLAFEGTGQRALQVLRETSGPAGSPGPALNTLLSEILDRLPEPVSLVLDDTHHVDACEPVQRLLATFLKQAPPNLHLFLCSRTTPKDLLARLHEPAGGCFITAGDLAFDEQEIEALFTDRGRSLASGERARILDQTGGWPMALQAVLSVLETRSPGMPGTDSLLSSPGRTGRALFDYLEEEVIQALPGEVRDFLEITSVPGRFNLPMAEALTGSSADTAFRRIEDLLARNLFLAEEPGEPGWYRYHALFRGFLQSRFKARSSADAVKEIQHRTASMLLQEGRPAAALNHALKAEDDDLIAGCMERAIDGWIPEASVHALLEQARRVPGRVMDARPKLLFGAGWANYLVGRWNEAAVLLEKALDRAGGAEDREVLAQAHYLLMALKYHSGDHAGVQAILRSFRRDIPEDVRAFPAVLMMAASSLMYMNRPDHALDLWTELRHHPAVQKDRTTYLHNVPLMGPHYHLPRGDLNKALEHIQEALAFFKHHDYMGRHGQFLAFHGQVRHELGEFAECRRLLEEAVYKMTSRDMVFVLNAVHCAQAVNDLALDEPAEARRELGKAEALRARFDTNQLWRPHYIHVARALLAAREGDAPAFHREAGLAFSASRRRGELWDLYQVACWLAQGFFHLDLPGEAVPLLEEALSGAVRIGAAYGEARCRLLLASAELDLGRPDEARASAAASLKRCREREYDTLLVARERPHALKLLPLALSEGIEPSYLQRVASRMGTDAACVLRPLLGDERPNVRALAAEILGDLGDRQAERGLLDLSGDPVPEVRRTAGEVLTRIRSLPPLPLRVSMLGPFRVQCGDRELPRGAWRRNRARSVLKYLLFHHGARISAETLVDLFFEAMGADRALDALYKAVSFLRTILEPGLPPRKASSYLESDGGTYRMILPPGSTLDTVDFEEAVDRGRMALDQGDRPLALAAWTAALEIYQGDFLEEDLIEEWTALPRERFQTTLLAVLKEMAGILFDRFEYRPALDLLHRVIETDSWDEEAYLLMMKTHLALGQRARAIETYRRCRDALKTDLDIDPPEALTRLYRNILSISHA